MIKSILDWDCPNWHIIDMDTGEELSGVVWADDSRGEFLWRLPEQWNGYILGKGNIKLQKGGIS